MHLSPRRRFTLGLYLLAGGSYLHQDVTLTYAAEDVSGSALVTRNLFVLSGELALALRFNQHVGANLTVSAPFPTTSPYLIGMLRVGLGLSLYFGPLN